jgi:S-DNA-T family DNA segregation ATPase FtsK/SpoIIIE
MKLLGPSQNNRLNEVVAIVLLFFGMAMTLSLASYHPSDPSWNTSTFNARPRNLLGFFGSYFSDIAFNLFGLAAIVLPVLVLALAWKWLRSQPVESPVFRVIGSAILVLGTCTSLSLALGWRMFGGIIAPGGMVGMLMADFLSASLNPTGAALLTATCLFLSLYLVSSFSVERLTVWFAWPIAAWRAFTSGWAEWRKEREQKRLERQRVKEERAQEKERAKQERRARQQKPLRIEVAEPEPAAPIVEAETAASEPPWETAVVEAVDDIPIRTLEDLAPPAPATEEEDTSPPPPAPRRRKAAEKPTASYVLPSTELLSEPAGRNPYDELELKETAVRIKAKLEEFSVLGSVVQINPGPVVTTFEFKPEAGIKISKITTLAEDLCLGLQAESIIIDRIPGKSTVGIEVPNTRREVISLRQILESDEFGASSSRLTMALGKDVNGRIKVSSLETMPHLLIAGSTGSGKSVMLNTLIMSVLYKSTPDEVRMILVDPKRLELGLYEGVPHLLTPVITDPKRATNALRNAVLEMERRLKLLASQGVRNIDQYNRKVRQILSQPRSLFAEEEQDLTAEDLRPLPYIVILIDELADLMMVERANVESSVTRLAQMARAVGMHLVLATQRPSVDVITGLIKANFPARISFRVATRVDSRTILDSMGAEHLLGKGDMLFLQPGTGRMMRVHGTFVTEGEINKVVEFWKSQAIPEYDQTFLVAPPSEDDELETEEFDGEEDPLYRDAVKVVLEVGKASTSVLQRRLRLGYGRAARILDMMQHDGIIGPPDGSKPREVLKRPDWLEEIESQV